MVKSVCIFKMEHLRQFTTIKKKAGGKKISKKKRMEISLA